MTELKLLGADDGSVLMVDARGQRYSLIIDDALRAAVRRDRSVSLPSPARAPEPAPLPAQARPKDLQALMRAGSSAQEVAAATGTDVDHVRRFEGPVLAERGWAVEQARLCRIGWEKDSPVLGDLVIDRLATRGVDPASLEWDALREGRAPWQITLTFLQGDEEKQATWSLDLPARTVAALDDEARWLTEAGAGARPAVFDQDSDAPGASAHGGRAPQTEDEGPAVPAGDGPETGSAEQETGQETHSIPVDSDTDALLADLASNRGRRVEVELPEDEDAEEAREEDSGSPASAPGEADAPTSPRGQARVVSMQDRRRAFSGNHPAGTKLHRGEPSEGTAAPDGERRPSGTASDPSAHHGMDAPTAEVAEVSEEATQDALPDMPPAAKSKPRRRPRRSVPSWDEIVFGAKPE